MIKAYENNWSKQMMKTLADRSMQVLQKLIFTALKSALFMGLPSRTDTCDYHNEFEDNVAGDLIW